MTVESTNGRWASARCHSEVDLSTVTTSQCASAEIQSTIKENQPPTRRRSIWVVSLPFYKPVEPVTNFHRSRSSNIRRASISEELKSLWNRRPSLPRLKHQPSQVTPNEGREEGRTGGRFSSDSDSEMTPAFFIVDRSHLGKRPLRLGK
ncbi:hypothetical protein Q1695_001944 [Nippostrongylus brasiliensis]|nr:hypothetical protein Q1695_001944 [Nippostrongylus brasiliensis]